MDCTVLRLASFYPSIAGELCNGGVGMLLTLMAINEEIEK
jgi:hypothetical protein